MKVLGILGILCLSACSTAMVTEGGGHGILAQVTGEASFCKVTVVGEVKEWAVKYKGKNCTATLNLDKGDNL